MKNDVQRTERRGFLPRRLWAWWRRKRGWAVALVSVGISLATTGVAWAQPTRLEPQPTPAPLQEDQQAWIGVWVAQLNAKLAERLALKRDQGVVVMWIWPKGPAKDAGVKAKDIILFVDNTNMVTVKDLRDAIEKAAIGATLSIKVLRGDQEMTLQVKTAERPALPRLGPKPGLQPPLSNLIKRLRPNVISGELTLVGENTISLTPKGQTAQLTYAITEGTRLWREGAKAQLSDFKVGDKVTVVSGADGKAARIVVSGAWNVRPKGRLAGVLSGRERLLPPGRGLPFILRRAS